MYGGRAGLEHLKWVYRSEDIVAIIIEEFGLVESCNGFAKDVGIEYPCAVLSLLVAAPFERLATRRNGTSHRQQDNGYQGRQGEEHPIATADVAGSAIEMDTSEGSFRQLVPSSSG